MICLYDSNETVFTSNGLVVLSDAISCTITEELNGVYELDLEYPLDERGKWQYLLEGNIIKADGQLFRIYHKFKSSASMRVSARHIFYDLLDNLLEDVRPTGLSGYGALDWILARTQYAHPFTSMGDVGGINTKYFVRKNPVDAIMGQDGIIASWGGELVRDNFLIKLLVARGLDRGVLVAYGKNIQGIEETLDTSGICTRLMPVGKDGILLAEKYIGSPYISNYPNPKIKVVDFSDCETEVTLRAAGMAYMLSAKIDIPQFNYKIDFLELSKTEEYKGYAVLERVYEGDTVTIRHSKLGIDLKAKAIKTTRNVLTDRLEKIELGSFKPNLATGINNAIQEVRREITNNNSFLELAIENATTLLTTALGGYVVKRDGELLIMDTEDPMTATKVWRWNVNGLGYSSTGINGPYGLAMTMDGHIVANFVDTGVLNAGIIKAGILKSFNNLSWINMENGTFDLAGKVTFDGTTFAVDGDTIDLSANTSLALVVNPIETQANLGVTNAATAKARADLGVTNAATAQTQANLGVANALAAQAKADLATPKATIISTINMSPEVILIAAEHVDIHGDTIDLSANTSVKLAVGQIGGSNLIKNSGFEFDKAGWTGGLNWTDNCPMFSNNTQLDANFNGKSLIVVPDQTTDTGLSGGIYQVINNLIVGNTYTFQAMVFTNCTGGLYCGMSPVENLVNVPALNSWQKVTQTFVATSTTHICYFLNYRNNSPVAGLRAFYLDNVQLEEGEYVTAWSPHASELKSGCFEVTDEHARFAASDGSYTEFVPASTGLTWHKAGLIKDYHYLSAVGTGFVNASAAITITLPVEFQGKNFTVLVSLRTPYGAAYASSQNNAAGTFVVTNASSMDGCSFNYQVTA